jgi:hypothetical protein
LGFVIAAFAQGDQEAGQVAVDLGHAEILGVIVEIAQLVGVKGEDGATGSVVERQYGIQVVLAHVADGKGHSLLRNDEFEEKADAASCKGIMA